MPEYAKTTSVAAESSRGEIESTLRRYGCTAFAYAWDDSTGQSEISFKLNGLTMRVGVPMPNADDKAFKLTAHKPPRTMTKQQSAAAYEQAVKQRWRALLLFVKAALEAVDCGITTVDQVFLSSVLLPGGYTIGECMPQIRLAISEGQTPKLLTGE